MDHFIPLWCNNRGNELIFRMILSKIIANQAYVIGNILGLFEDSVVDSLQNILLVPGNHFPGIIDQPAAKSFY